MNRWLKRASIGLCVALLPVWTQLLPADATSTDQLFFNVNAGDPGSYTSGSPTWTDLAGDRDGTIFDTDGKRITYDSTNKALVFPGDASSYVDMGSGFSDFGSGLTIEFEGHFGAANQGWERIFDFGNTANPGGNDNIWVGVLGDGGVANRLAIEVWIGTSSEAGRCHTRSGDLEANVFAKWVITLDGTRCRMYKNGTELQTDRMAGNSTSSISTYVNAGDKGVEYRYLPRNVIRPNNFIGKSNWSVDPAFNGAIKYVRMYTTALTSEEAEANAEIYTLTYSSSGVDSGTAPASQTGNGLVTLAGNTGSMVKAGHAFGGWATSASPTVAVSDPYNLTADITLQPLWVPTPSAPQITASSASATSLNVAITAPTINSSSVTGYQVEYSTNGSTWTVASSAVAAGASSYTITGLTTGTPYYVRVAAKYASSLSAYGYNWQKIHEVISPKRTSPTGAIVYASGFGLANGDAATTHATTAFTRIRYRMTATNGGSIDYVDADFKRTVDPRSTYSETFDSIERLRVPTPDGISANQFEIQGDVTDLSLASSVTGVNETGSGWAGRLEIWPWNYDPAAPSTSSGTLSARAINTQYDDSDTFLDTLAGSSYGSFQLHRLDAATAANRKTIFAWNLHGEQTEQEIGFGNYSGTHSDWTFASRDNGAGGYVQPTNFNLQIFIDVPVTPTVATYSISYMAGTGGSGTAPSSPSSVPDGSTFVTPANTFTRAGYTFAGWSDGSATYAAGATYPTSGGVSGNVTLTATWSSDTFTVTTDEQGGSSIANVSTQTGSSISSPGTPTRDGHTFAGWFETSSGGTAIAFPWTHGKTASFTLYAQWTVVGSTPTSVAPASPTPLAPITTLPTTPQQNSTDAPNMTGPTTVRPGKTLTMTADGFTPGETVVISVDGKRRPQRLVADANGEVRLTITLTPDLRPGTVTVRASGASASVTRQLRIAAPITSLPETGGPSTTPLLAAFAMIIIGAATLRRRRNCHLRS